LPLVLIWWVNIFANFAIFYFILHVQIADCFNHHVNLRDETVLHMARRNYGM